MEEWNETWQGENTVRLRTTGYSQGRETMVRDLFQYGVPWGRHLDRFRSNETFLNSRGMPNTFSQLYIHHVSTVKHRDTLITNNFEVRLYQYIAKITQELTQTLIQINGMPDHIHIAARLRPAMAPSPYVQK